ncbi:MAG: hypothetical protein JWM62_2314 [Frankiales bacterium]|nr:hypothetical protein [Frankiales bacterium]
MFWLLLCLLLLVALVALGLALLTLWRRVKVLGRQVAEAGETAAQVQQAVVDARVGGPLEVKPCPTCGTPVPAKVLREAAARA